MLSVAAPISGPDLDRQGSLNTVGWHACLFPTKPRRYPPSGPQDPGSPVPPEYQADAVALTEISAVSKLGSLCDRAISRLSHSSLRSAHVTANANATTTAHGPTLDCARCRGADPGYFHEEGMKHEIIFLLFNYFPFWGVLVGRRIAAGVPWPADSSSCSEPSEGFSSLARERQWQSCHFDGCLITQVNSGVTFQFVFLKRELTANAERCPPLPSSC